MPNGSVYQLASDPKNVEPRKEVLHLHSASPSTYVIETAGLTKRRIGKAMPLYYAADALRRVMMLNAGFDVIGIDLVILIVYSIITMAAAIPVFEKTMTR